MRVRAARIPQSETASSTLKSSETGPHVLGRKEGIKDALIWEWWSIFRCGTTGESKPNARRNTWRIANTVVSRAHGLAARQSPNTWYINYTTARRIEWRTHVPGTYSCASIHARTQPVYAKCMRGLFTLRERQSNDGGPGRCSRKLL